MEKKNTVTLSLSEVFALRMALSRYGSLTHAKSAYFVARNLTLTESFEKDYAKVTMPTEEHKALEKAREDLLKKHAVKDDSGNPVRHPVQGRAGAWQYDLVNTEAYEKELQELRASDEHSQGAQDEVVLEEKRLELLELEHDVTVYALPFSSFVRHGSDGTPDTDGDIAFRAADLAVFMKYGIIRDDD